MHRCVILSLACFVACSRRCCGQFWRIWRARQQRRAMLYQFALCCKSFAIQPWIFFTIRSFMSSTQSPTGVRTDNSYVTVGTSLNHQHMSYNEPILGRQQTLHEGNANVSSIEAQQEAFHASAATTASRNNDMVAGDLSSCDAPLIPEHAGIAPLHRRTEYDLSALLQRDLRVTVAMRASEEAEVERAMALAQEEHMGACRNRQRRNKGNSSLSNSQHGIHWQRCR